MSPAATAHSRNNNSQQSALPALNRPAYARSASSPTASNATVHPFTPVTGPSVWYADQYKHNTEYIYDLSSEDVAELDAAVAAFMRSEKDIQDATKQDFVLPMLGPKLVGFREEVRTGRGFQLIRGVPVDRYSRAETIAAYWGFGLYWGKAVSQNKKGHLIGHIKDLNHDPANPNTRLYATHEAQPYHNDSSDIVALLCLKNAQSGGLSSWSSSMAVHNEILRRRPDLAPVMAAPWYMDRKGEVPEGKQPYFQIPIFNYFKGGLSINYSDNYYHLSQRHADVPRLTQQHYEAMALFNEIASSDALRMDYMLQPGDVQLLNNHTQLHTRAKFEDFPDFNERRHLLRLWIAPPVERPLPDAYLEIYGGSVEIGNRGGIKVAGYKPTVPLEAE